MIESVCHRTFPGHEPDVGDVVRAVERELLKWARVGVIGDAPTEDALATVLAAYRQLGVPAVRARYEGDAIVVDVDSDIELRREEAL